MLGTGIDAAIKLAFAYWAALGDVLDDIWASPAGRFARDALGVEATDRGQIGTIIEVGVIGISIIVMILIYSQVQGSISLGGTEGDPANNTNLQNAAFNATDTFGQAMELAPVIMVVLLAAVVIAVVQRFRS